MDKRQFTRVEKHFLASYEVLSEDKKTLDRGIALEVDLSLAGLHLEIPGTPKVGDTMKIVLAVKENLITVMGEVVWIKLGPDLNKVGCKLTNVQKEYKETLKEWLISEN